MGTTELLDVVFRWAHLIAGIMWIGNSMLFNWLDRNLEKALSQPRLSQGKIFMVHSGAFYDVEKKLLEPGDMPSTLHWFKWQNFTTWATGVSLMVVVYYLNGAAFLVDPSVRALTPAAAIAISVGGLVVAWVVYDLTWRTLGARAPALATGISIACLCAAAWGFAQLFSGRAAYIEIGVIIGTVMTGNVWMVIVPSQRELVDATKAGREQDPTLSIKAKQRSIHNNYLTFPLLFIMLSNHFPSAYGHKLNWLILCVVMLGGAGVRHFMNVRYLGAGAELPRARWLLPAAVSGVLGLGGLVALTRVEPQRAAVSGPVGFARAQEIIVKRCASCHAAAPTDDVFKVAPANVMFDTAAQIQAMAPRILERAVKTATMPFVNKTQMTDHERAELGAWIAAGARLE